LPDRIEVANRLEKTFTRADVTSLSVTGVGKRLQCDTRPLARVVRPFNVLPKAPEGRSYPS